MQAKGEFILFLNSGDFLYTENSLQLFKENLNQNDEIYYGNIMYENSLNTYTFRSQLNMLDFLKGSIGHGASFIKTNLFKKFGNYNENNKIVSDWEFFILTIIINNVKHKHIDEIITNYQEGGISVNEATSKINSIEREQVLQKLLPNFFELFKEYENCYNFKNYISGTKIFRLGKKVNSFKRNFLK
jgi:hypothetical protein